MQKSTSSIIKFNPSQKYSRNFLSLLSISYATRRFSTLRFPSQAVQLLLTCIINNLPSHQIIKLSQNFRSRRKNNFYIILPRIHPQSLPHLQRPIQLQFHLQLIHHLNLPILNHINHPHNKIHRSLPRHELLLRHRLQSLLISKSIPIQASNYE